MPARIYNYDNEDLNLTILQEECAEVIKIVSKIKRFGWESTHPDGGPTNRDKLAQELGDVWAMVDTLICKDSLFLHEITTGKKNKLNKMVDYYEFKHNTAAEKDRESNKGM